MLKKRSKAQVSMEYLLIFGFAFMMTVPLLIIYATQVQNVQTDLTNAEVYNAGSEIIDAAEEVYFMGPPAQKTLNLEFPSGIESITLQDGALIFSVSTVSGSYDLRIDTVANLTGSLRTYEGYHEVVVMAEQTNVTITD